MAPSSGLRACPERNKGRNAAELCSSQKSLASRWLLLMGSCHQPPGSATSLGHPSQPLPSRIKFSLNNSADCTHEAFPLRVDLCLGAFRAPWSLRAGTGPVEVFPEEAKSASAADLSCSLCTSEAARCMVWMCRESNIWVRGTAQTREDAFTLEQ